MKKNLRPFVKLTLLLREGSFIRGLQILQCERVRDTMNIHLSDGTLEQTILISDIGKPWKQAHVNEFSVPSHLAFDFIYCKPEDSEVGYKLLEKSITSNLKKFEGILKDLRGNLW